MNVYSDFTIPAFGRHVTLIIMIMLLWNRHRSVGIVTRVLAAQQRTQGSILGSGKSFFFFKTPRPPLGPTKSPIQWVPAAVSYGKSGKGVKMTTHHHLVPRL
jgi:hypothetical protein